MAPPPTYQKAAISGLKSDLNDDDDTCSLTLAPCSNHFIYFNYFTPCFTTQYYFLLFYTLNLLLFYYNFNFSILHLHFISCLYL